MHTKTSRSDNLLGRIYERGEEAVAQALSDLLGRKGVADQLGKTMGRAASAKRRVDRNMQFVLSLLNIPSRADFNKLLAKIEALQGSLVNLNMKLDRLIAAEHEKAVPARPRRTPRKAPPRHHAGSAQEEHASEE